MRNRPRQLARVALGLCPDCGERSSALGGLRCSKCRDEQNARHRAHHRKIKATRTQEWRDHQAMLARMRRERDKQGSKCIGCRTPVKAYQRCTRCRYREAEAKRKFRAKGKEPIVIPQPKVKQVKRVGAPPDPRRKMYADRFGLSERCAMHDLPDKLLDQLDRCASDTHRRLILGVKEKGRMRMLDLFAGRLGWSKAFLERGWEVVAIDWVMPDMEIPEGVRYIQYDIMHLYWSKEIGFYLSLHGKMPSVYLGHFDFVCASSPCEKFSIHGMKHFHPNPPWPTQGIELFNYTRTLLEESGVPYIMENVRSAQAFVGNATHHWGPFYLWGPGVPVLAMQGISKGMNLGSNTIKKSMTPEEKRAMRKLVPMCSTSSGSKARKLLTAGVATIPPELANCAVDYAERICEPTKKATR